MLRWFRWRKCDGLAPSLTWLTKVRHPNYATGRLAAASAARMNRPILSASCPVLISRSVSARRAHRGRPHSAAMSSSALSPPDPPIVQKAATRGNRPAFACR